MCNFMAKLLLEHSKYFELLVDNLLPGPCLSFEDADTFGIKQVVEGNGIKAYGNFVTNFLLSLWYHLMQSSIQKD